MEDINRTIFFKDLRKGQVGNVQFYLNSYPHFANEEYLDPRTRVRTPALLIPFMSDSDPSPALITALLNAGANSNARNYNGDTALLRVLLYSHALNDSDSKMVTLLIQHGADPTIANVEGKTPLIIAARRGFVKCVQILLATRQKGAPLAPLVRAQEGSRSYLSILPPELAHKIAEFSLHPETKDNVGKTALQYAIEELMMLLPYLPSSQKAQDYGHIIELLEPVTK